MQKSHICDSCEENQSTTYCMQCSGYLCNHCDLLIHQNKLTKKHQRVQNQKDQFFTPIKCRKHNNHVTLLCAECQELICSECFMQNHKQHANQTLPEAFEIVQSELLHAESALYKATPNIQKMNEILTEKLDDLASSFGEIHTKTTANFDELIALLISKKQQILQNLESQNVKFTQKLAQKQQFLIQFQQQNQLARQTLIQCKNSAILTGETGEVLGQKLAFAIDFFMKNFEKISAFKGEKEVIEEVIEVENEVKAMPEICLDLGNLQRFIEGIEGLYLAIQDVGE
ncbi:B-box Zinc finger domain-containing protein [Spironucleus salmonicida]|uniref:B-box Zinc finger domain-containing protein n=1 Tax=Spironucleus salmonicida TaxID=348837 RepID=V6LH05_9EUKA|nr:B-box Zinc finger domain-containing protein [Spironucleus salmonicida]|eukprot:EST42991.1 B-box Zinc finger domain-containing protein [Spironucleus salmonicida]